VENKDKIINLLLLLSEKENYWIFKIEDKRRNFLIDRIIDKNQEYTYQYKIKTVPKEKLYGKVLFFYFDEILKEWVFEFEGNIKNTEEVKEEKENENYNKEKFLKITFDNIKRLEGKVILENVMYSLKKIQKFETPYLEIKNNLNKITPIEYDAIVDGEIYYSRTVFYKLFNSLHKEHKIAFYSHIFNSSKNKNKIENNFSKLLPLLQGYIETHIYNSAILFIEAINVLQALQQDINLDEIGFDSSEEKSLSGVIDYSVHQIEYSKQFISNYDSMPKIDEIRNEYENFKETEEEFYKIFKNTPFPTELL